MTMRKKDYEAIARAFQDALPCEPKDRHKISAIDRAWFAALECVACNLADRCATQDPTFKRERFLADCGVSHD